MNGITRGTVVRLWREHDVQVFERDFSLTDVYGADEAFVNGTFGGLTPVADVDGRRLGERLPGPVTERLLGLYPREMERWVARSTEVHGARPDATAE